MAKKLIMRIIALLILLLVAVLAPAKADPARWLIKDKDTTIILFGTLHALRPGTNWMSPLMREDLRQIQTLYLEVAPDQKEPAIIGPLVQRFGLLTEPIALNDRIGDALTLETRQAGLALGLDPRQFDAMRLWLVGSTLASASFTAAGYSQDNGVEDGLIATVKRAGGTVAGLETIEQQLGVFASLSLEEETAVLRDTLDQIDTADDYLANLSAAYLAGDVSKVADILNTSFSKTPALYDKAIVARNRDWALKIEQLLERPGVFAVAVGTGHLAGENNLIDFLNLLAINVTRLQR